MSRRLRNIDKRKVKFFEKIMQKNLQEKKKVVPLQPV